MRVQIMLPQVRQKGLTLFILASCCLLFVAISACSSSSSGTSLAPPVVGDPAPSFEVTLISGDIIKLEDFQGKGMIVNFWATWCPPCVQELPLLDSVAREHSADGLTVIAVNMGETEEKVSDFLKDFGLGFPVALDSVGEMSRRYQVLSLPMTFFIDREGIIRYRRIGALEEDHFVRGLGRIL